MTTAATARNLLLLAVLGLGPLGSGGTLLVSPSGKLLGMPLSRLAFS